jgi:cytidylate kinase
MDQKTPHALAGIANITVSGRIASGATTLARQIAERLNWEFLEGGELFEKFFDPTTGNDKNRPDSFDLAYEEKVKKLLREEKQHVIQSHLAGFDAQGIKGVFKIGVVCEDEAGNDKAEVRFDRLVYRKGVTVEEAKKEVLSREAGLLEKWRRLYANNDPAWVYWDRQYFDLVVNTYTHNKEESLQLVLKTLGME